MTKSTKELEFWNKVLPLEVGTKVRLFCLHCKCLTGKCGADSYLGEEGIVIQSFRLKESDSLKGRVYPFMPDDTIVYVVRFKDRSEFSLLRSELEAIE